jgi:anti-anti-sigma factor
VHPVQQNVQPPVALAPVAEGAVVKIAFLDAHLDFDVADVLREHLKGLVAERLAVGHRAFLLELTKVEVIDSCGVGTLIAMHHQVAAAGGVLAVIGATPFVGKVLKMMRLDRYLKLFDSEERALKSLVD